MKIVSSALLFLLAISSIATAEIIDVNIKGIDDGRKTNRQQDYREAVMNAKLQAIEQAGASIESITKVVNFQLKYDAVESKSKAVLRPGFQIIDIGYVADGTYQIVLVGKIQTIGQATPSVSQRPPVVEAGRDGRFIAYSNGTVLDTRTTLMWAAIDNGRNINWQDARSYCESYRGGGYTDWRMPTQDELKGLQDMTKTYKSDCGEDAPLTELIHLTCTVSWASETDGFMHAYFFFGFGGGFPGWNPSSMYDHYRVLPVRSGR